MPKTFNSVWIHLVFSTREREKTLSNNMRNGVSSFLRNESVLQGFHVDSVNGYENHLHILYKQKLTEPISDTVKWFKGRSSKWINDNYRLTKPFRWQTGYGVFSVSRQNLDKTWNYIYNQEKIHQKRSLDVELSLLESKSKI
jgi:REP element-mobilizing transposase RayT